VQTDGVTGPRVLALDVGGTKLAAALVTADGGVERCREVPTPSAGAEDGEGLWSAVLELIDDALGGVAPTAVGAGCGGPLRLDLGEVSPLNIPAWRGFPLRARLEARFPGVPVRVHNDASAMALGEQRHGAGRGTRSFLGVVVSTGVGAGVVLDGTLLDGPSGNAGHLGHVSVDPEGPACACGGVGCLEAVARGPAVVVWALEAGWRPPVGAPDGRALVGSARDGDPVAVAALQRAGRALGFALANAAHLFELQRVAVGGGLAVGAGELLLAPAREAFAQHARLDFAGRCEIVPAQLGREAGMIGAAELVR
jgi:glucokinase